MGQSAISVGLAARPSVRSCQRDLPAVADDRSANYLPVALAPWRLDGHGHRLADGIALEPFGVKPGKCGRTRGVLANANLLRFASLRPLPVDDIIPSALFPSLRASTQNMR